MEQLALKTEKGEKLPIAVDGAYMNFSGVETKASRMAESEKCDKSALALGVLENVRDTLVKTINKAMTDTNTHRVLIVGGDCVKRNYKKRTYEKNLTVMCISQKRNIQPIMQSEQHILHIWHIRRHRLGT